jgi:hypothetical protein
MANDPSIRIDIAAEFVGKKAFASAEKSTNKLEETVGKLGKKLALAFSAKAVFDFASAAVKAFAEDEKSAAILANTMKNLGLEFQNPAVETFISKLSAATGEIDDNLRPAMQKLLQVTGSVMQSQKLLTLALDVAAGSGQSLDTVVSDLAAAMAGNTKGLRKYALGLTSAELQTMSFESLTAKLASTFEGSAAKAAETFAGQLKILSTAAGEAQETIGKGLVDAFNILSGDSGGITTLTDKLATLAQNVADITVGMAIFIDKLKSIPGVAKGVEFLFNHFIDIFKTLNPLLQPIIDLLTYFGKLGKEKTGTFQVGMSVTGATDYYSNQQKAITKAEKDAEARRLAAIKAAAATKAKLDKAANAKNLATQKAAAMFDLNKIQIAAALKSTYDKDERLRLLAMQALENDNGEAALEYIKQLNLLTTEQQTNKLAGIKNISENELNYINQLLLDELQRIKTTKMTEEEAALARQAAYAKYNAAIQQSGGLAEANFYSEKTQVELLTIAKLAALDTVAAAQTTMDILNYKSQTDIIDKVAAAQAIADKAKMDALKEYLAEAGKTITQTVITKNVVETPDGGLVIIPDKPKTQAQLASDLLAAGSGAGAGTSSSMFNPYAPGNGAGFGTQAPPMEVTINIEGLIDTGNFDEVVNQAMINAQRKGFSQYAAGALP